MSLCGRGVVAVFFKETPGVPSRQVYIHQRYCDFLNGISSVAVFVVGA